MFHSRSLCAFSMLTAVLVMTACGASKSSNPLEATVAGPIPGVDITAPTPVNPTGGTKVAVDEQPVTLTVANATSNSPRPLRYVFEVATDAGFTNRVFSRESITPGDGGRTSVRLPDPLATDRSYYWRARAEDGANTGPYSGPATFNVITPIVIGAPTPVAPGVNVTVPSARPKFVFSNASQSGPIGPITYIVELSTTESFANKITFNVGEQPNETSIDAPQDLTPNTVYFWHVRAADPTTTGPWSVIRAFQTPPIAPPLPVPGPGPGPGGTAPPDMIDLTQASVHNSPNDVAYWPATSTLTRLDLMPSGVHIESTKQDSWPQVTPPGWDGPLQYTLWIVLKINGQWHTSGCIEYWRGLYENGGPVTQYAQNWYYDPIRWGPMAGHQPAPGEMVGFFVTAGDSRNNGPVAVKERTNVVLVPFPGAGGQSFRF